MTLSLNEEECLAEKVKTFPVLFDKTCKGSKEKDVVENAWEKVAESLDFVETGSKAQILFSVLKKKYARKKKERRAADVSGTSSEAVIRAQKALQPYEFMSWIDGFTHTRPGRSKVSKNKTEKIEEESGEDLFCKSLASDLKELPPHEKYMAKNEIRNVIFKYQMMVMNKQQTPHPTTLPVERTQRPNSYRFPLNQMSSSYPPPAKKQQTFYPTQVHVERAHHHPYGFSSRASILSKSSPSTPVSWVRSDSESDNDH